MTLRRRVIWTNVVSNHVFVGDHHDKDIRLEVLCSTTGKHLFIWSIKLYLIGYGDLQRGMIQRRFGTKYWLNILLWVLYGAKRIIQLVTGNNIWKTIWETPRFPWMSNLVLNELLEDFIEFVSTQVEKVENQISHLKKS